MRVKKGGMLKKSQDRVQRGYGSQTLENWNMTNPCDCWIVDFCSYSQIASYLALLHL